MPKPVVGAPLVRKGGADLIQTEKHGLKKVRRWNPHTGEWALTALGRQYFDNNPTEYILSLPVQYHIDKKGQARRDAACALQRVVPCLTTLRGCTEGDRECHYGATRAAEQDEALARPDSHNQG